MEWCPDTERSIPSRNGFVKLLVDIKYRLLRLNGSGGLYPSRGAFFRFFDGFLILAVKIIIIVFLNQTLSLDHNPKISPSVKIAVIFFFINGVIFVIIPGICLAIVILVLGLHTLGCERD